MSLVCRDLVVGCVLMVVKDLELVLLLTLLLIVCLVGCVVIVVCLLFLCFVVVVWSLQRGLD